MLKSLTKLVAPSSMHKSKSLNSAVAPLVRGAGSALLRLRGSNVSRNEKAAVKERISKTGGKAKPLPYFSARGEKQGQCSVLFSVKAFSLLKLRRLVFAAVFKQRRQGLIDEKRNERNDKSLADRKGQIEKAKGAENAVYRGCKGLVHS